MTRNLSIFTILFRPNHHFLDIRLDKLRKKCYIKIEYIKGGKNMVVIYAEKRDMAEIIAQGLDKKYKKEKGYYSINYKGTVYFITWGTGHMCELWDFADYDASLKKWDLKNYPYFPETYKIKVKNEKRIKDQYKIVKELFNKADLIINATDADREGEVIFHWVYSSMKCKVPYKRLWLNTKASSGIKSAMDNLKTKEEMENFLQAGLCRAYADCAVGFNSTVYATKTFGSFVTTGRVQTPTLALIVNREDEILNFKPEEFWTLKGKFVTNKGTDYEGVCKKPAKFTDEKEAKKVLASLKGKNGKLKDYKEIEEKSNAPLLMDQDELQSQASARFKYSAKKTLDIAEALYNKKFITYPRTSCRYLPENMRDDVRKILHNLPSEYDQWVAGADNLNVKKPYFDDSQLDGEGHFALIPQEKPNLSKLTVEERNIYDLIVKSFIRIYYTAAVTKKVEIITSVDKTDFHTSGKYLQKAGWFAVDAMPKDKEVPAKKDIEPIQKTTVSLSKSKTTPPARYTDGTLVKAMKACGKELDDKEMINLMKGSGIGTVATRAATIDGLEKKQYIERKRGTIYPTVKGCEVIHKLNSPSLTTPLMTGEWEIMMQDVRDGKLTLEIFMKRVEKDTRKICSEISQIKGKISASPKTAASAATKSARSSIGKCPLCGGDVEAKDWGWGCSNWRQGCKFSLSNKIKEKKISEATAKKLVAGKKVTLKGFQGANGKYDAAISYNKEGKLNWEFKNNK